MNFFGKKLNQHLKNIENEDNTISLQDKASDKAVEVIKELSGENIESGRKLIDDLIVFTNASGGTGASTLLSNVAYSMTQKGLTVIIIDLNLLCPVQHTYFGITQEIEKDDLVSYLLGKTPMAKSINSQYKIHLLYANNRGLMDVINCNSQLALDNLAILLQMCREYYDVVLVDCPMRIDCMLENTILYEADTIYMVWDEGASSIINTEKLRRNMAATGIDSFTKMRIILNKRTSLHYSDYSLKKLNLELVETLPFDIDIIDNSMRGRIFAESGDSTSPNAIEFVRKIDTLTDKIMAIGGYIAK